MSDVPFIDPLTARLMALAHLPLTIDQSGTGCGSSSQLAHLARWNSPNGIREVAVSAGLLNAHENEALRHGLDNWPWLTNSQRKNVNAVVNMLFYIRRHFGFADFDRQALQVVPHFCLKPKKERTAPDRWRRSNARRQRENERMTFVP